MVTCIFFFFEKIMYQNRISLGLIEMIDLFRTEENNGGSKNWISARISKNPRQYGEKR